MVLPTTNGPEEAVFTTSIFGEGVNVTVSVSVSVTSEPVGGVPVAVAILTIDPALTSSCVTRCVAEPVVEALGASVVAAKEIEPRMSSFNVTLVSVTLPVLVTSYV